MNAPSQPLPVSYADVAAAAERIAGHAHRTPVLTSRTVDARTGAHVFFKCENLQRIGAFKFRGAYNALPQLSAEQRRRGVLTFSSGNHAQAVALAGQLLGIATTIVMPARRAGREARGDAGLRRRGHHLRQAPDHPRGARREHRGGARASRSSRRTITRTSIAGQGTAAKELIEEIGAARLPVRALRRRRPALGLRDRGRAPVARLQGGRRRARRGRRRHALVPHEDAADGAQPGHDRRRRAHALARQAHLPAGARARRRHDDRGRSRAPGRDALLVGADEDRGRADRRARRGGALRGTATASPASAWAS